MVGLPQGIDQKGLQPRQHHLLPLSHNPAASEDVGANTNRQQPHPPLHCARPPTASGVPLVHRRGTKNAGLGSVRQGGTLTYQATHLRHTGMRQLLPRCPPASLVNPSSVERRSSTSASTAVEVAATAATLNRGAASGEQPTAAAEPAPSSLRQRQLSSARPAATEEDKSLLQLHRLPSQALSLEDGVPGGYRATATQFMRSIERLNRMTALTCSEYDNLFFGMTEERAAGGAASMQKMSRVPLLPLTLCTDGETVILVDPNGTERHKNYLQAVDRLWHCPKMFTSTASSSGATPPFASHTLSKVLWWTLSDLQRASCAVPLTNARATFSSEDSVDGQCGGSNVLNPHLSRPTKALESEAPSTACSTKTTVMLAAIQPNRLTLRYGEPLVLVFASSGTRAESEIPLDCVLDTRVKAKAAADVVPRFTEDRLTCLKEAAHLEGSSHIGHDLLRDIHHGFLPSLLESIYPDGGVHLRGCWCDVSTSAADALSARSVKPTSPQRQQQQQQHLSWRHNASWINLGNGEAQRSSLGCPQSGKTPRLLLKTVRTSLVDWSPPPTARRDGGDTGARDAEGVMQSLRPTSLPPLACPQQTLPDAVLNLPPDVLRFLALDDNHVGAHSTTTRLGKRLNRSSSSLQSTVRRIESDHELGSRPIDAGAESPVPAADGLDSSRVCVGGDCRGVCERSLKGPQPQQRQARHEVGLVYVSALLHAPSQPPPVAMTGKKTIICESVVVLTPAGRVELVVPEISRAFSRAITIADVEHSLVCSAVGRSLHLYRGEFAFIYAPGTEELLGTAVVDAAQAVLRLQRRTPGAQLEAAEQQPRSLGKGVKLQRR
ncbi:hypothetical protein JKF63_06554 [Porcisia hertigi]|uniref:Uncharacterized protein n=1 Tax=Porcisia hertigi TaxID=2761500 RepID=A0A836LG90_9TRYP|nr:hypothetical protein JKF63_06554 [Porcisia hertigi]